MIQHAWKRPGPACIYRHSLTNASLSHAQIRSANSICPVSRSSFPGALSAVAPIDAYAIAGCAGEQATALDLDEMAASDTAPVSCVGENDS